MEKRRCSHCGRFFTVSPRVGERQKFCGRQECQRFRKSQWTREKLKRDEAYRLNQAEAQRLWRQKNPGYWRAYRQRSPAYTQRNRVQIVEALCEEVLEHLRLGLICISLGRELSRLPRGNQAAALSTVQKYKLTTRETCRLVSMWLEQPRWGQEALLRFPEEILSDRSPPAPRGKLFTGIYGFVQAQLEEMKRLALTVMDRADRPAVGTWRAEQGERLPSLMEEIQMILRELADRMEP